MSQKKAVMEIGEEHIALLEKLEDLFWGDPVAYVELCKFCRNRRNKVSEETFEKLRGLGFLEKITELPDTTNEVVYMATTGKTPFWW